MCGRVTQFGRWAEIVRELGVEAPEAAPRYNVTPGTPVVTVRAEDGVTLTEPVLWGFRPRRAVGRRDGRDEGHANARAESAYDKPTFRESAGLRRCLVPVDGYYEWSVEGRARIPHYFRASDGGPLALAGLWSVTEGASPRRTFCVVTVAPNREAAAVHSRMPVLLMGEARRAWLSGRPFSPDDFADLARTAPDGSLAVHRVGPEVGRAAAEGPGLISPLGRAAGQSDFLSDLLG